MQIFKQLKKKDMKRKNTKTVKITVPSELVLKKIKNTPAFNRLSRLSLQIGENIETVNHKQFADMLRLYPIAGCIIKEVNS